jgi:LmbE family N-acetylglucosaminyl deacetylase
MRRLGLVDGGRALRRLLVIGCHPDDIEIGCGGTVLALTRADPGLDVTWLVLAASGDREREARASAEAFLAGVAGSDIRIHGLRDGFLPYGPEVKELFEALKGAVDPDVIFTHTRGDLHQDHRLACELTWNTFRDHLILEYEVPKFDGDLGRPNVYVELPEAIAHEKVRLLARHFASQADKHWFDDETFLGLMRLRGVETGSARYAEAFVGRKVVWDVEERL